MKNTLILNINNKEDKKLKEAAEILKENGTVAFPTETVYGLGANALNKEAVDKIFIAKGRPSDNPLIVHISSIEDMDDLVKDISDKTKILLEKFCPGPLTLILNKSDKVPLNVTAGLNTIAIRIPSHEIANELIKLSGVPIAAPSANISGRPSPTEGHHVVKDLDGRVDCIILSKKSEVGLESTILDMTREIPMILRPGGITIEDIEMVIGKIDIDLAIDEKLNSDIKPKAPGMKYTHYSPDAEVIVISGGESDIIKKIYELKKLYKNKSIGIMCSDEMKNRISEDICISLGSKNDMKNIATNVFTTLRKFDELNVDIILAEGYDTKGVGKAIMNRLNKAAGFNIINV